MKTDKQLTFEEAVQWMRNQPQLSGLVENCYFDEDNFIAAKRFASSEEFDAITQILKLRDSPRPLKILDLGCGNGIASYAFAALGHDVYAVDPDESNDVGLGAVSKLQNHITKGSIVIVQAFAESLPFEANMFDIVYTRQALHHFSDLTKGLKECCRVLKDKGHIFSTRDHVIDDEDQLREFLRDHDLHKFYGGENAHKEEYYLTCFQEAELKVEKVFLPFDTVINHFPESNKDIERRLRESLSRKLRGLSHFLYWNPALLKLFRKRLSKSCDRPGRLYSFLAIK